MIIMVQNMTSISWNLHYYRSYDVISMCIYTFCIVVFLFFVITVIAHDRQESVVLRRTVCDDIDWRFDNMSGSRHQSQVNCESSVDVISLWSGSLSWLVDNLVMLLVICQLSHDVISWEDCKTWLVHFDPSFASQMSIGLLLDPLASHPVGSSNTLSCLTQQKLQLC